MFSYYGSKSKIVDYYPAPLHDKIIEPFAGSARYSLKYWKHDVTLIDKYSVIIDVWKYLQQATEKDIIGLPILSVGTDIRNVKISEEELLFMRFTISQGDVTPRWIVSPFCTKKTQIKQRKDIAKQLYKIRHWNIIQGDYVDLENTEQTWFIDPPYQFGGHKYIESNKNLDFDALAEWCKTRKGQVIVCENTKANWMKFEPMVSINSTNNLKSTEAIWTNYDRKTQPRLFN